MEAAAASLCAIVILGQEIFPCVWLPALKSPANARAPIFFSLAVVCISADMVESLYWSAIIAVQYDGIVWSAIVCLPSGDQLQRAAALCGCYSLVSHCY